MNSDGRVKGVVRALGRSNTTIICEPVPSGDGADQVSEFGPMTGAGGLPAPPGPAALTPDVGHETCIAAGEISSLGMRVTELSSRLATLEEMVAKLEEKNEAAGQASPAQLRSAVQQMLTVSRQVEIITEGLRSTPGYNLSKTFSCSTCGSVGVVAIKVKCTRCGGENWWGWWPCKDKPQGL